MEQKLITDLVPGDSVLSFFIVRKKEIKEKKSTNETYLSFDFGDRSSRIRGSLWKDVQQVNKNIRVGDIVKVKGKVITFLDYKHISIDQIRKATVNDKIDPEQFLPTTSKNIQDMYANLKSHISDITNPSLQKLIKLYLTDKDFVNRFCKAPGGKLWHHAYLGGLLEHTLSVIIISKFFIQHYQSSVNADILLCAAFLHDIGKIEEFSTQGFIDYSTPGRLLGHITLGANMVMEKISQIPNFPERLKQQLIHCMLSHHGQKEKGSPVVPMTLEALILNFADDLDSTVAAFQRIMAKEKEPGKLWSNYVNLIDRFIYFGGEDS
ncbi:MAG: HD domain-containing protein [bacterium]|nr:MAG: HD domain-containing protein [bacterium]